MREDIQRVLLEERTILERLDALARAIRTDYEGKELTVLAVLRGSLMFAADLLRRIPLPLQLECLSVSSYHGGTVSSGTVRFESLRPPSITGRHVLILDDILDSGLTLEAIAQKLPEYGAPASVRTCVLLQKRIARRTEVRADYVGFEIEDAFVVGYGLDYHQRYRNLPFVGVLHPAVIRPEGSEK